MPTHNVSRPEPKPIRHTVRLTGPELVEALRDYAAKNDIDLPEGDSFVWGLDNQQPRIDDTRLTLVVDADQ